MADKDYDPTAHSVYGNGTVLFSHILQKGFQVGSLAGLAVVLPAVTYRQWRVAKAAGRALTLSDAAPSLLRAQAMTALAGVVFSGALGAKKVSSLEDIKGGLEDRAYRLHHNESQSHTDLCAQVGSAVGGTALGLACGWGVWSVLGGASLGTLGGMLAHLLTYRKAEREPSKMLKEF